MEPKLNLDSKKKKIIIIIIIITYFFSYSLKIALQKGTTLAKYIYIRNIMKHKLKIITIKLLFKNIKAIETKIPKIRIINKIFYLK